jgi:hypothetical protein
MSKTATTKTVEKLWSELDAAIDAAARDAFSNRGDSESMAITRFHEYDGRALRALIADEISNEKAHRRTFAAGRAYPISVSVAAKLIILENIGRGAASEKAPSFTIFIDWRRSAADAYALGYLLRAHLSSDWIATARLLDYSEAVKDAN